MRLVYRIFFAARYPVTGCSPEVLCDGQLFGVGSVNGQHAKVGSLILLIAEPRVPGFFPYYL